MPKQVQCKRCFHLYNDWCIPKMDSPDPDIVRDCQYYIATKNGDRIRRMTNEKLAKAFTDDLCELLCGSPSVCDGDCDRHMFDWLNKETES